jgi:UDP-N-acetylglucosamine 4-epimerase
MSQYLVTGGAGFIGSNIVERLLRENETVRVLDDFSTGKEENLQAAVKCAGGKGKLEIVRGDIRDEGSLDAALEGIRYVFH